MRKSYLFYPLSNSKHVSSEQSEAHRAKNKAARERRAQRIAAKKESLLGPEPVETPVAAAAPVAEKKEKAPKQKK